MTRKETNFEQIFAFTRENNQGMLHIYCWSRNTNQIEVSFQLLGVIKYTGAPGIIRNFKYFVNLTMGSILNKSFEY